MLLFYLDFCMLGKGNMGGKVICFFLISDVLFFMSSHGVRGPRGGACGGATCGLD